MSSKLNLILFTFVFALAAAAEDDYECGEDEDCPQYHFCDYTYASFNSAGSQCISNIDATFGPACNGDDSVCQENDEDEASTAMCFQHEGQYGCRNSYFMPCNEDSDCAQGFGCEYRSFIDGQASVCVPAKWYSADEGPCETNHDCGYATYFGHRWMPCFAGRCAVILAK